MLDNMPAEIYELSGLTITFRVALAMFVGGLIGTERDIKNRAAGIRTHMLVCLGAAVVMMTNQYVVESFPESNLDITRMGAQVVSGIGFLGAGTILVTSHNRIRGLTTAAGLWAAATLGLAIGIGFYEMAIIGSFAILFIVIFLRPFKQFVQDRTVLSHFTLLIYTVDGLDDFLEFTSDEEVKLLNMNIENEHNDKGETAGTIIKATIELAPESNKEDFIKYLKALEGVNHVVEI
ncbi:MgtC/SapB family protein [Carnobacteriaceae bacterium 52-44]